MTPDIFFLLVGVALIAVELLIVQFSVFWFLFFGLGALIASLVCWLLPELGWTPSIGLFFVASVVTSAALYPPLRKWQAKPSSLPGHDAIGQRARVVVAITADSPGKVLWSGTEWAAEVADPGEALAVGDTVLIRRLEGIRLFVSR
jgi:membrane protein implicated in regulation of membrane protease activity